MAKRQRTESGYAAIRFVGGGQENCCTDEAYRERIASFIYEDYPERPSLDVMAFGCSRSSPENVSSLGGVDLPAQRWTAEGKPTSREIEPLTKYIKETVSRRMQGFKAESAAVHQLQDVKFEQASVRPIYEYNESFLASLCVAGEDPSELIRRTLDGQRMVEEQTELRTLVGYRWYLPIETGGYQNGQPRSQNEVSMLKGRQVVLYIYVIPGQSCF